MRNLEHLWGGGDWCFKYSSLYVGPREQLLRPTASGRSSCFEACASVSSPLLEDCIDDAATSATAVPARVQWPDAGVYPSRAGRGEDRAEADHSREDCAPIRDQVPAIIRFNRCKVNTACTEADHHHQRTSRAGAAGTTAAATAAATTAAANVSSASTVQLQLQGRPQEEQASACAQPRTCCQRGMVGTDQPTFRPRAATSFHAHLLRPRSTRFVSATAPAPRCDRGGHAERRERRRRDHCPGACGGRWRDHERARSQRRTTGRNL